MSQNVMDTTYGARIRHEQVNKVKLDLSRNELLPKQAVYSRWRRSVLDFEQMSQKQREKSFEWFLRYMYVQPLTITLPPANKKAPCTVEWVPGHRLYKEAYPRPGLYMPEQSDIMIIGKCLGEEEAIAHMQWVGPGGTLLRRLFESFGLDTDNIYGTNVLKFLPPYKTPQIPKAWLDESIPFLLQEIELVKPKCILLLGSDALKALFGKQASLKRYRGTVMTYKHGIKCIAANNPAHILRHMELMPGFRQVIKDFCSLSCGREPVLHYAKYDLLRTEDQLRDVVNSLIAAGVHEFGVDCEWAGERYNDPGAHLLTIQFSCKPWHAYVVMLRSDVSNQEFSPSIPKAVYHLRRLFCRDNVAIYGHNFRADIQWLIDIGLDVSYQFAVNGLDTMLANHILEENDDHDLSSCVNKRLEKGRYDLQVQDRLVEVRNHCNLPDELLWQYAADDADATYQLGKIYKQLLWKEHCEYAADNGLDPDEINLRGKGFDPATWVPTLWNLYFEIVLKCNQAIIEMEMNGLLLDEQRMKHLIKRFHEKQDELLQQIRQVLRDPEFNPGSPKQVAGLLFGPPNWTDDKGVTRMGFGLIPVKTTSSRPEMWDRLIDKGLVKWSDEKGWLGNLYNPSTDAESLGILADIRPEASIIRDWRFINQVCKNFLREPEIDKDTGEEVYTKSKGLAGLQGPDGRVHTTISQLTETGRWRSSHPNLQNLPKGREGDLARIFRPDMERIGEMLHTIRSCFKAPEGHVLIEADLVSAELYTLAYLANDKQMKEDLERKDDQGNKISLHTTTAISVFKLNMTPAEFDTIRERDSPEGLRLTGLRVAAKSVNFGIPCASNEVLKPRELQGHPNVKTRAICSQTPMGKVQRLSERSRMPGSRHSKRGAVALVKRTV